MFEQKMTKQVEQNLASLPIESPEVGKQEDATPKLSAYDRLITEIKRTYGSGLSEHEAHKIARNLMGFCQKLITISARLESVENSDNDVDLQRTNSNVPIE